jgi:hypothetical protein
MIIQQDTREQQGKKDHILQYFADNGIKVVRSKLFVGDWTRLDKQDIVIDTKGGCAEVYSNIVQQHVRFRDECIRAQQCGIKLIILVEDESITDLRGVEHWKNPRYIQWCKIRSMQSVGKAMKIKQPKQPPLSSIQLMDRMKVMSERYGIEWQFTTKAECGRRIVEILGGTDGRKD